MRKKLTDTQVRQILCSDEIHKVLAARYGVAACTISNIKSGQIYRHMTRNFYRDNSIYPRAWCNPFLPQNFMPTEGERVNP